MVSTQLQLNKSDKNKNSAKLIASVVNLQSQGLDYEREQAKMMFLRGNTPSTSQSSLLEIE